MRAGVIGGLFAGGLLYACVAYVPLVLTRQLLHEDALTAGAALMPLLIGWAVGSSFGVHVLVRWGMRVSVAGGFGIAHARRGGAVLQGRAGAPGSRAPSPRWGSSGLGLGPAASTALVAPQSHVAWRYRGMMTSTIYACRMLGGSLAVAALGSQGSSATGEATPTGRFVGILVIAAVATLLGLRAPSRVGDADAAPAT